MSEKEENNPIQETSLTSQPMSRRRFLGLLAGGAAGVTAALVIENKSTQATTKVVDALVPRSLEKPLTTAEVLRNLIPENSPYYIQANDLSLVKDAQGVIRSIRLLGNKLDGSQDPNQWRIFDSTIAQDGIFPQLSIKAGDFSGDPRVFHVYDMPSGGFRVFVVGKDGIVVKESGSANSSLIPISESVILAKAFFPDSGALVFGKTGELILINVKTLDKSSIPVSFDAIKPGTKIGAKIQQGALSTDKIKGKIYDRVESGNGIYGIADIGIDFTSLSLNGEPQWYYRDKRSDVFFVTEGQTKRAFLYDRNRYKLFIADHNTKQQITEYGTQGILNRVTEENLAPDRTSIIALTADDENITCLAFGIMNGDSRLYLVSWPLDVNPELIPEKVTYRSLANGLVDEDAKSLISPNGPIEPGNINGEFHWLIDINYLGPLAIKTNLDGSLDPNSNIRQLAKGVTESYQNFQATATSTPTNPPTATPTIAQKIHKAFMPVITRFKGIGW